MPCYSGFPRQSGRDAIKKRKQERRTRGRGGRESSVGERVRERGTKCRESDEISAWYIDHRIRDFSIFSLLNNFDRGRIRNRNDYPYQSLEVQTIKVSIPVFDRLFPARRRFSDLFFFLLQIRISKKVGRRKGIPVPFDARKKQIREKTREKENFFFFFIQRISVSRNEQYMTYYKDAMYR